MPLQMQHHEDQNYLELQMTGKLVKEDYHEFVPTIETIIQQHGPLRILLEMHDFHGWSAGALWEDLKFDLKHFKDIGRLAVVGESKWQEGMAKFCKPFTSATIKYFEATEVDDAKSWIIENS